MPRHLKKDPKKEPSRSFCCTLNNYTDEEIDYIQKNWTSEKVRYCVAGKERGGKNDVPHLQIYVELPGNPRRPLGAKSYLGVVRLHVESRVKSREDALNYCLKEIPDGETVFFEVNPGRRKSNSQGLRSDLARFTSHLESGGEMGAGAVQWPGTYVRNYRGLASFQSLVIVPKPRGPHTVEVHWGDTGTGKSRYAQQTYPEAWWFPRPITSAFFGGYNGESTCVLDDFDSWIPFTVLLRM